MLLQSLYRPMYRRDLSLCILLLICVTLRLLSVSLCNLRYNQRVYQIRPSTTLTFPDIYD
jgi:hypothetical protein